MVVHGGSGPHRTLRRAELRSRSLAFLPTLRSLLLILHHLIANHTNSRLPSPLLHFAFFTRPCCLRSWLTLLPPFLLDPQAVLQDPSAMQRLDQDSKLIALSEAALVGGLQQADSRCW